MDKLVYGPYYIYKTNFNFPAKVGGKMVVEQSFYNGKNSQNPHISLPLPVIDVEN